MLDKNIKIFVMHITFFSANSIVIYPAKKAKVILLFIKKMKISTKYLDFLDIFLKKKDFGLIRDNQVKSIHYQAGKRSITTL